MVTFWVRRPLIYPSGQVAIYCVKNLSPDRFWSKVLTSETCSTKRKAHEMCLFTTNEPGETTRKLRHDIIYSSLSIRLSKSPIDCAFNLLQRLWLSLLNTGCKVNCTIKRQSILNKVWVICVGIITMRSCRVVYPLVTFSSFTI